MDDFSIWRISIEEDEEEEKSGETDGKDRTCKVEWQVKERQVTDKFMEQ